MNGGISGWYRSGAPWIWLNAAAVAACLAMVFGLLLLLGARGLGHFWPKPVLQANYLAMDPPVTVIGEIADSETVDAGQLQFSVAGAPLSGDRIERQLLKLGNRDITGNDFAWILPSLLDEVEYPERLVTLERREWGNFYGFLSGILQNGEPVAAPPEDAGALWSELQQRLDRARQLRDEIEQIERSIIADINFGMEGLRLQEMRLLELNRQIQRDSAIFRVAGGAEVELPVADIVRAYRPNAMSRFEAMETYLARLFEFLTDDPRESNTEGGLLPAIYGTAMMVLLMSVLVTPLGVVAAVYLSEYAPKGWLTHVIRISVNNLAGVPSIVYGMFGLGFFIYLAGGEIDRLFYSESLPAPTFGTPGLLWASLTLALLTLPVVIVATEEGLANIPASLREGSLALGATKFETLWRVILPLARPSMLTGLILAVARAAGEVAPLMLVGVVKLAPALPLDTEFPYLHLEQQFMHLGYYVYDLATQSPNVEAAMPQAFAAAFLLVAVVAALNLSAVIMRGRLRERYKALDTGSWS
ncbi:MAG: phosphate ABC transporter permease PstA [Gammaproteobacteria bacterium]|nr:phosphate ABC transporter permease PstA [Gammaproteobacteria bacterium]MYA68283.1 phosphate ABC transporter permease PstA [Gammaproteobacteria bacterium]MYH47057.1 phosphate ABC transporter permease PstA [Gammaproteobacteria bacterium]MYL14986.1 phosphate ABC transporter permease PstA [Gammaproteobacteria bacterium]